MNKGMTTKRDRIAIVSDVVPSPQSRSGFAARLSHFMSAAAEHMDTTLILILRPDQTSPPPLPQWLAPERIHVLHAPRPPWAEPGLKGRVRRRLGRYVFSSLPPDCYPRTWPRLREILGQERPDVAAFYLPYLAHLAGHASSGTPVIGILEEAWERLVAAEFTGPDWRRQWLARKAASQFRTVYRQLDRRAAAVVAISPEEEASFGETIATDKILVIPHGVDTSYFRARDGRERDIDIVVVGDLRSPRNYVGALSTWEAAQVTEDSAARRWAFVGEVDPEVASALRKGGATVTGPVDDVRPYYERARTALVPSFAGTGVKTTSLQAWAMRCPLVASPLGARGLPARATENLLIGDDPTALVEHLEAVLRDRDLAERLANAGRSTAERYCDLAMLGRRFANLCQEVVEARAPASR